MAETDSMQALVSRRADRREAQQAAQSNQPEELSMSDIGTFIAEATPIIGDAIAAKEVYDELQKENPNYYLAGALGGAAIIGLIPGIGDAAAQAIRTGARRGLDFARRIEVDPNSLGSNLGNVRLRPENVDDLPPPEAAQRTQIAGTLPTYRKANDLLTEEVGEGATLDFGAGLGLSQRELGFDTFEPFPREGFNPTYSSAKDIPDESYERVTNLNVLNVVPREARDEIVRDIGRILRPGGVGIITTRGRDVMAATGRAGPEEMSIITSAGTYQKGFTQPELRNYIQEVLGETFEVRNNRLGAAGVTIRKLPEETGFNEGGVAMKNQMEFLFEEGGMADDGLDRDPVSGNEVPSGSMSEEVRDDIPAQLSEGEYVVPADVVRYFGVKYFEDLRDDAKMGLTQMEQEGRIGGEPVDMEGDDTELTAEEQAELDAIMGMAMGGVVSTTYDRIGPQAVGNINQQQQSDGMEEQMTRAFQEGGDVLPIGTQLSPDYSGFGAGYTFGTTPVGSLYPTPPVEPITTVTLYSPEGASLPFNLPTQQAAYDSYIAQGWTTQPPAAPVAPAPVQQPTGDDNDDTPIDYNRSLNQAATGSRQFSLGDIQTIRTDPIGYATSQLQRDTTKSRVVGGIVSVLGGPLGAIGGGALSVAGDIEPIANARAALLEAQRQNELNPGTYTAEQIEAVQNGINARISELPLASRTVLGLGNIGTGERYARQISAAVQKIDTIHRFDSTRPDYMRFSNGETRGLNVLTTIGNTAATLQGRAAQMYAEDVERNDRLSEAGEDDKVRTGTSAGGVPIGNISGVTGINGVVPDPVTGKAVRVDANGNVVPHNTPLSKVVFRDTEGRTYVRGGGLLGNSIEYVDIPDIPSSDVPPPQNTEGVDTGNNDNSGGSVICTALFNKGLLSKEIFMLDTQYGLMLESSQPEVTYGYRKMATPLANYIQKDTLGATIARTLVAPVAKAWANEMAHQMQPENYKGNLLGKAIIKLGYPVCAFVGKRSKEIVYGT